MFYEFSSFFNLVFWIYHLYIQILLVIKLSKCVDVIHISHALNLCPSTDSILSLPTDCKYLNGNKTDPLTSFFSVLYLTTFYSLSVSPLDTLLPIIHT
jgi:hypothetical protein